MRIAPRIPSIEVLLYNNFHRNRKAVNLSTNHRRELRNVRFAILIVIGRFTYGFTVTIKTFLCTKAFRYRNHVVAERASWSPLMFESGLISRVSQKVDIKMR